MKSYNIYNDKVELSHIDGDLWKMTVNCTLDTNSDIEKDEIFSSYPDSGLFIKLGMNKIDVLSDNEWKQANIFVYGIELKSDGLYLKISNFVILNNGEVD